MHLIFNTRSSLDSQLAAFLADKPGLKTLDLTDNQLGVVEQKDVCKMLSILVDSSIEELILRGTGLGYKSGEELQEIAGTLTGTRIKSILMGNNFLGIHKTVSDISLFFQGLKSTDVNKLDLTGNLLERLDPRELRAVLLETRGIDVTTGIEKMSAGSHASSFFPPASAVTTRGALHPAATVAATASPGS